MLAPIVFYLAAGPIRKELGALHLENLEPLPVDDFVQHMQETMRRALARTS